MKTPHRWFSDNISSLKRVVKYRQQLLIGKLYRVSFHTAGLAGFGCNFLQGRFFNAISRQGLNLQLFIQITDPGDAVGG